MMLGGNVEIDELFIGGLEKNKHANKRLGVGGGAGGKQAVLGLRERESGRVTLMPISDRTRETLHGRIHNHVKEDAIVHTDKWTGYKGIDSNGEYVHYTVNHSAAEFVRRLASGGIASMNAIEAVFAVVKRGFIGTCHNWSAKYGFRYLNKFAFRLNQGNVSRDTTDRLDSLLDGIIGNRLTYADLTANG